MRETEMDSVTHPSYQVHIAFHSPCLIWIYVQRRGPQVAFSKQQLRKFLISFWFPDFLSMNKALMLTSKGSHIVGKEIDQRIQIKNLESSNIYIYIYISHGSTCYIACVFFPFFFAVCQNISYGSWEGNDGGYIKFHSPCSNCRTSHSSELILVGSEAVSG